MLTTPKKEEFIKGCNIMQNRATTQVTSKTETSTNQPRKAETSEKCKPKKHPTEMNILAQTVLGIKAKEGINEKKRKLN
jgi:hypothetical protein